MGGFPNHGSEIPPYFTGGGCRYATPLNPDGWIVQNEADIEFFKDALPVKMTDDEQRRHERWKLRLNPKIKP